MPVTDPSSTPFVLTCRWAGRFCSAALCTMVVAQMAGSNLPISLRSLPTDTMQQTAFLVTVMGLVVGWLWEGAGALMILGGMTAYTVLAFRTTGLLPDSPTFFFWIPGLLFLTAAALSSRIKKPLLI